MQFDATQVIIIQNKLKKVDGRNPILDVVIMNYMSQLAFGISICYLLCL